MDLKTFCFRFDDDPKYYYLDDTSMLSARKQVVKKMCKKPIESFEFPVGHINFVYGELRRNDYEIISDEYIDYEICRAEFEIDLA